MLHHLFINQNLNDIIFQVCNAFVDMTNVQLFKFLDVLASLAVHHQPHSHSVLYSCRFALKDTALDSVFYIIHNPIRYFQIFIHIMDVINRFTIYNFNI